ncbi:MAG TPA: hypothetical protein VEY88_02275 [Archangium sp.]|nr:hypothetical protein [Archangium sp.]
MTVTGHGENTIGVVMGAPFFTFSPGEIQRSEFDSFFEQLTSVLAGSKGLVIVMDEFDDLILNRGLCQQLACDFMDFRAIQQGVLYYKDWFNTKRDLWLLMSMAEPRFIFGCSGSFESLLELLHESYAKPQQEAQEHRAGAAHGVAEDREKFAAGLLVRNFSPVLSNVLGKFTLFTHRRSEHP